jgi:hypothetical protein
VSDRTRERAREWLRGWVIDKYRLLEILDGESGEKMIDGLAALLDEVEEEDTMKWRDVVVTAERERDEARAERDVAEAKFKDWSGTDVPALNIALSGARAEVEVARALNATHEAEVERLRGLLNEQKLLTQRAVLTTVYETEQSVQAEVRDIIRALVEAGDRLADDEDPIDPALEAWAEAKRKAGL